MGAALAIGGAAALGIALTGAVWAISAGRGTIAAHSAGLQVVTTFPNPSPETASDSAPAELVGAKVARLLFLIELKGLNGRERLPGYEVESLITYD